MRKVAAGVDQFQQLSFYFAPLFERGRALKEKRAF